MNDEIDLGVALDTIVAKLAAQFPSFKTVAAEDASRGNLELPALIVQFAGIDPEPDRDPSTGQWAANVRVECRIVMGHRTAMVRREVIKAAAALGAFAHQNRFGILWSGAAVLAADPDEFSHLADKFDVWVVEWAHLADLGTSFVVDEGVTPTGIFVSQSPDIGIPNEAAYVGVVPDE